MVASNLALLKQSVTDEERVRLATRESSGQLPQYMRQDESKLSDEQKQNFIKALNQLVASGQYNRIVNIHAEMRHDMHGRNMMTGRTSRAGVQRFLPWHRSYLVEFEKALKTVDASISVPYWNWLNTRSLPDWLTAVMPKDMSTPDGEQYNVTREIGVKGPLPNPNDIKAGILSSQTYTDFTLFLEGWKPYGAHNQIHNYVGGTMGTMYSPADPVFWMHHAQIDRLWHIWQLTHAEEHPSLLGKSAVMDPWQFRYKDLVEISGLGYNYDSTIV